MLTVLENLSKQPEPSSSTRLFWGTCQLSLSFFFTVHLHLLMSGLALMSPVINAIQQVFAKKNLSTRCNRNEPLLGLRALCCHYSSACRSPKNHLKEQLSSFIQKHCIGLTPVWSCGWLSWEFVKFFVLLVAVCVTRSMMACAVWWCQCVGSVTSCARGGAKPRGAAAIKLAKWHFHFFKAVTILTSPSCSIESDLLRSLCHTLIWPKQQSSCLHFQTLSVSYMSHTHMLMFLLSINAILYFLYWTLET